MKVGQLYDHILVELKMSAFLNILTAHHVNQRLIPFSHFFLLGRVKLKLVNDIFFDLLNVKAIGTDNIFDLPHIQQIFRYVFFMFLRCDIHTDDYLCLQN